MQNIAETPDKIAMTLLQEYVFSDSFRPILEIDKASEQIVNGKMWLYRIALSLMVLLAEEQAKPELTCVREQFEIYVFPASQEEDTGLLDQVRLAMQDLKELLHQNTRREFSWSISWFNTIGVDENDPINLTLFATGWMNQYKMVTDILQDAEICIG